MFDRRVALTGLLLGVGLALSLAACGGKKEPGAIDKLAQEIVAPADDTAEPADQQPANTTETVVHILAVDRAGKPLPGMMPIATSAGNAFDEPFARGEPTGDDGRGLVRIPSTKSAFVRCWDPTLGLFANNFHEVPAAAAGETEELTVTMLPASGFDVQLLDPEEKPIAAVNVSIMMVHPSEGPWWPSEAVTDAEGRATFNALPPGRYAIRFKTANGTAEAPDVLLMPGEHNSLAPLHLQ